MKTTHDYAGWEPCTAVETRDEEYAPLFKALADLAVEWCDDMAIKDGEVKVVPSKRRRMMIIWLKSYQVEGDLAEAVLKTLEV